MHRRLEAPTKWSWLTVKPIEAEDASCKSSSPSSAEKLPKKETDSSPSEASPSQP